MIMILGASGYIASAFVQECLQRGIEHIPMSRKNYPYDIKPHIALKLYKPSFVINASAFIPQPSVDLCKDHKDETLKANLLFPIRLATICAARGIPMAHISTGCLYDERTTWEEHEYPIRSWDGYCGFYLRSKWLSEIAVMEIQPSSFVWRIRLPFDEYDSPRNYLTKLRSFKTVWNQTNSLTHRGDFVKSALSMIERKAEWGTYNCCNSGSIQASRVLASIRLSLEGRLLERNDPIIHATGPVPGCRLSTAKLEATGCGMRPVSEAVEESLRAWKPS